MSPPVVRERRCDDPPSASGWMRPALTRLLRGVLGEVQGLLARRGRTRSTPRPVLHPARVATLRLGTRPPRADRLAAAERELAAVHLNELAFQLRQAARLRCEPADGSAALACREGLREAVACARGDALPLARSWRELALACSEVPLPERWPRASALARAALEVEPCEEARAALARALLVEGDAPAASSALAAALLSCPSARRGAALLDELAAVEQRLGRRGRARALRGWAARAREVA